MTLSGFSLICVCLLFSAICYHVTVWDRLTRYYPEMTLFEYVFLNDKFVITPYGDGR